MKFKIKLIKYGFPLLLLTDYSAELFENEMILNISRALRMLMLFVFIIDNIKYYRIIKHFYFYKLFLVWAIIFFFYIFTDRIVFEGFWIYSKILFWILGMNILYAYSKCNFLSLNSFFSVVKKAIIIAFLYTAYSVAYTDISEDYNLAAYLLLFMYPMLLWSSNGFSKNLFYVFLTAIGIIVTLKRGALLAFFVSSFIYFMTFALGKVTLKKIMLGLFVIFAIFFIGVYTFNNVDSERVGSRFDESQFDLQNDQAGSGRVGMYKFLYSSWRNSDDLYVTIFGFGNQADMYRNGGRGAHAHSDILGFLYNHGLVGISLIVLVYIFTLSFYFKYRKKRVGSYINIIWPFLVILVLVNFYSGLFRANDAIYLMSILPYLQSQIEKNGQNLNRKQSFKS